MAIREFDDVQIELFFKKQPELFDLYSNMEQVEEWTLDLDYKFKRDASEFISRFDPELVAVLKGKANHLLVVLGLLSAKRSFFLLKLLEEQDPDIVSVLNSTAKTLENEPQYQRFSAIYFDRMATVNSNKTMSLMLHTERLSFFQHCLNKTISKHGGIVSE